jgi:hypothetical protein
MIEINVSIGLCVCARIARSPRIAPSPYLRLCKHAVTSGVADRQAARHRRRLRKRTHISVDEIPRLTRPKPNRKTKTQNKTNAIRIADAPALRPRAPDGRPQPTHCSPPPSPPSCRPTARGNETRARMHISSYRFERIRIVAGLERRLRGHTNNTLSSVHQTH